MDLPALADAVVSIYLPETIPASFQIASRYARQTNYISPLGNFSDESAMPVGKIVDDRYILGGLDVVTEDTTGSIVCIGYSLTDGNISTHDAYCRSPDQFARRLFARKGGRTMAVMNQGLGGNRILHDGRGSSGLRRFDRDVLAAFGVTHAIICLGINDIRNRMGRADENVTAEQTIAGLKQLATRAKTRGIVFYGGTLPPFENETFFPGAWTPEKEAKRQAVNN
jgi:lysophospholipase L1-like esterase